MAPGNAAHASAAMPPAWSANALTKSMAAFIRVSSGGGLLPATDVAPAGGRPALKDSYDLRAATTSGVTFRNSALCLADRREIVAATSYIDCRNSGAGIASANDCAR